MSEKGSKIVIFLVGVIGTGVLISSYFLYFSGQDGSQGKENLMTPEQAGQKAVDFINEKVISGATASLLEATEEEGIYKIKIEVEGQKYDSYVSKDGKYLFPEGFDLTEGETQDQSQQSAVEGELTKREKPDVKLFVMSYCPYGLQAQKMFLPVYDLLKDKAEMGIYFVNYIMHDKKEIDENLNQYCIQKAENVKYPEYLSCFLQEGKTSECMTAADIDQSKIQNCISATDQEYSIYSKYEDKSTWLNGRFPLFEVHSSLNETYGVGGSPTLVINDSVIVNNQSYCPQGKECVVMPEFTRAPESFKQAVCNAFNSPPEECSQTLSDTPFQPGFGLEEGSSSGGACGS